jgi:hypothetical protein
MGKNSKKKNIKKNIKKRQSNENQPTLVVTTITHKIG